MSGGLKGLLWAMSFCNGDKSQQIKHLYLPSFHLFLYLTSEPPRTGSVLLKAAAPLTPDLLT